MAVTKKSAERNNIKKKKSAGSRVNRSTSNRKKVTTSNRTTRNNRTGSRKNTGKNSNRTKRTIEEINEYKDYQAFELGITLLVIAIISFFFYLSYFQLAGRAGDVVGGLSFGILGWFAWFFPLFCMIGFTFFCINQGDRRVPRKIFSFCGMILSLLGLTDIIFEKQIINEYYTSNHVLHKGYFECMYLSCKNVIQKGKFNGGLIGRAVSTIFTKVIGKVGAGFILFALFVLCVYIFYGVEMMATLRKRNAYKQEMGEIFEEVMEEEEYQTPSYRVFYNKKANRQKREMKQMRKFEKVPRVSHFDLQKINEQYEKLEDAEKKTKKKNVKTATAEKTADNAIEEIIEKKEQKNAPSLEVTVTKEDNREKIDEVLLEHEKEIPIFRNELDEKFRKKEKSEVKELKDVTEIKLDSPENETIESKPTEKEEIEKEEIIEESVLEEEFVKHQKPMNSFVHKEEVVDVTPSCQKQKENDITDVSANKIVKKIENTNQQTKNSKVSNDGLTSNSLNTVKKENPLKKENSVIQNTDFVEEKEYLFPSIELLSLPENSKKTISDSELRLTASKLQDTLKSFNVDVKMGSVTCGPTVTRYELLPAQGVRVNKITNLVDDLKLSLAASSIRIEAPIPGKAAVGIEVPNSAPSAVHFRELLEGDAFKNSKSDLTFAVGKDIGGKLIMTDISKMPHLLIAGATGSGKSVCINTLIMSIIYKANPKDVKLIMIDPKVVELSVYNGIPHLFCPVVTDPKEAAAALNWAVREMMDRYEKFKECGVRNISGYNEKISKAENKEAADKAGYEKMPYLVVIVDEFADLMMVASKEVEDAVCRLAQLARAAGIHLVLATQRPSVNVITGVIKANIPSRIAFSVSSVIDSRTILDRGGAEKLLGKGDMLFYPAGSSEPVRVQGAFISDNEVSDVVDFLRENNETPEYNNEVTEIVETEGIESDEFEKEKSEFDEYFEDAGKFVIESDRAAAGQLQRRFSIGFNRAGRIIDQLNKVGVVGPAEGTKPRKVLMTMEEFENVLSGNTTSQNIEESGDDMLNSSDTLEEVVVTQESE